MDLRENKKNPDLEFSCVKTIAAFLNSTLVEMGSETLHHWLSEHLQDELEDLKS